MKVSGSQLDTLVAVIEPEDSETVSPGEILRATYDFRPLDRLYRAEFYIWPEAVERWRSEGMPEDWRERNIFKFDPSAEFDTGVNLGWTDPPYLPAFEETVVESAGDCDVILDTAGRLIKVFRNRRHGFMPVYLKHPVTGLADWEAVSTRLSPEDPARWAGLPEMVKARRQEADRAGGILVQRAIGGYMYLRALVGPEDLMYMFFDHPEVIHAAMRGWFDLVDSALSRVQAEVDIDEIFLAEDICYNHGLLISPDLMREFLLPYYQQVLSNARARQKRTIYLQVDTDGDCRPAIPIYAELGLTRMSPFEVASGCDVVEIGRQYPNLVMSGGIDKRVLASGKEAIEAHLQYIIPFMLDRGGYYPTCDHGVPDDVSYEDYAYYRNRVCELGQR